LFLPEGHYVLQIAHRQNPDAGFSWEEVYNRITSQHELLRLDDDHWKNKI